MKNPKLSYKMKSFFSQYHNSIQQLTIHLLIAIKSIYMNLLIVSSARRRVLWQSGSNRASPLSPVAAEEKTHENPRQRRVARFLRSAPILPASLGGSKDLRNHRGTSARARAPRTVQTVQSREELFTREPLYLQV